MRSLLYRAGWLFSDHVTDCAKRSALSARIDGGVGGSGPSAPVASPQVGFNLVQRSEKSRQDSTFSLNGGGNGLARGVNLLGWRMLVLVGGETGGARQALRRAGLRGKVVPGTGV